MIDNLIYILAITIIIFLVILAIINKNFQESRLDFLTDKEKRLFHLLLDAFPEMHVFPHVSCITIIEPSNHIKNVKKKKKLMKGLSHQFFLFSLFDKKTMEFVCAVEFAANDKEIIRHDGEKLQSLIEDAKIKTLRISPFGFVDKEILRQQLSRLVDIHLKPINTLDTDTSDTHIAPNINKQLESFKIEITEPVIEKEQKIDKDNAREEHKTIINPALDINFQSPKPKESYWENRK